jgi:hypothetical protein
MFPSIGDVNLNRANSSKPVQCSEGSYLPGCKWFWDGCLWLLSPIDYCARCETDNNLLFFTWGKVEDASQLVLCYTCFFGLPFPGVLTSLNLRRISIYLSFLMKSPQHVMTDVHVLWHTNHFQCVRLLGLWKGFLVTFFFWLNSY